MTDLQLAKLGKILRLLKPRVEVNMTIYIHETSRKEAKEIMRQLPKSFRRKSKVTESGHDWSEARKSHIYGLGRLEVTVFYPKRKGGEKS